MNTGWHKETNIQSICWINFVAEIYTFETLPFLVRVPPLLLLQLTEQNAFRKEEKNFVFWDIKYTDNRIQWYCGQMTVIQYAISQDIEQFLFHLEQYLHINTLKIANWNMYLSQYPIITAWDQILWYFLGPGAATFTQLSLVNIATL